MRDKVRSPIDGVKIRRQPGQSAQSHADLLAEDLLFVIIFPIFVLAMAIVHRMSGQFSLVGYGVAFVIAVMVSWCMWVRRYAAIRKWRLGAKGERYVGQILDREMSAAGYKVYHDIQIKKGCRKMNIDHLVVGGNGIYLIEDKTWSKPIRGQTVVKYNGRAILKNGVQYCAPVNEAFALAKEAHDYIAQLTGVSAYVKPVLVFVGWYNKADNRNDSSLLVLSEKTISAFIKNHCPQSIPTEHELRLIIAKLDAANT